MPDTEGQTSKSAFAQRVKWARQQSGKIPNAQRCNRANWQIRICSNPQDAICAIGQNTNDSIEQLRNIAIEYFQSADSIEGMIRI